MVAEHGLLRRSLGAMAVMKYGYPQLFALTAMMMMAVNGVGAGEREVLQWFGYDEALDSGLTLEAMTMRSTSSVEFDVDNSSLDTSKLM